MKDVSSTGGTFLKLYDVYMRNIKFSSNQIQWHNTLFEFQCLDIEFSIDIVVNFHLIECVDIFKVKKSLVVDVFLTECIPNQYIKRKSAHRKISVCAGETFLKFYYVNMHNTMYTSNHIW